MTVSVEELPAIIIVGEALIVTVGALLVSTVTVAVAVALAPFAPVAVSVYVVVAVGLTVTLPPDVGATVPTPLLMDAEAALVVVHDSVELLPAVMVVGLAVNEAVGLFAVVVPLPAPQALRAIINNTAPVKGSGEKHFRVTEPRYELKLDPRV